MPTSALILTFRQTSKQVLPTLTRSTKTKAWPTWHSLTRLPLANPKRLIYSKNTSLLACKALSSSSTVNPLRQYTTTSLTVYNEKTNVSQAPVMTATAVQEENMNEAAVQNEKHESRVSEIKDAKLIFNQAFKNVQDVCGRENMRFPKEIIWLMGAPGSGKGTHTPAILRARGITNPPISMSSLLSTPECKELINKGLMISDGKVVENLLHALLDCEPEVGVLVDGFPRSEVQVECLKLFHERMHELRREFKHTTLKDFFPRPTFRICVLYVDEEISVSRQLMRGKLVKEHNAQVLRSGKGEAMEERVTDFNELLIRARYQIFKDHYSCLLKLSKIFPFHLINAVGSIESVMRIILKEFEYQSSLELEHDTYEAISHIPLATKIGTHARQDLIRRLEHYCETEPEIFSKAVRFIDQEVTPMVVRHAISGQALVRSQNSILSDLGVAEVIISILSERGYAVTMDERVHETPKRVDPETWEIILERTHVYALNVRFPQHHIQPLEQKF
ncbi:hypothetical protein BGZ65_005414 [Modicella reniformis]|uniref:Adenylate kinase n=1 Tax=Modicella reniformis TaxID=1440133 RepID=A0A9P6JHS2_9FUNG|nr:hypothetical protein BGZ65_005414 [Modicella reniformis]